MGKKGKWLLAVRKVFGHEGNEENNQKNHNSKSPWRFGSPRSSDPQPSEPIDTPEPVETSELIETATRHDSQPPPLPRPPPPMAEVKVIGHEEDPNNHAYSVAIASAVAAEAAAVAAKAAAEVVRLTANAMHPKKAKEESAAIKIQTAIRGYQARIALRHLRGLVRLKEMVKGNAVRQQTITTLRSMQTLSRVQWQIRSRKIRMEEENEALLNQLQLKHERELEKLKTSANIEEDWDTRIQSKEEIEARILHRQDAAQRREKALAYAFSHQWKAPSRAVPPMFTDPANPQWGWSWLERWMETRPWENIRTAEMNERASLKSDSRSVVTGETIKVLAHQNSYAECATTAGASAAAAAAAAAAHKPILPTSSPSTPRRRSLVSSQTVKKSASPRGVRAPIHDDSRSVASTQPELHRRHSIAGSITIYEESSSTSSQTVVPHHLTSTTSTRAKSRVKNSPSPETANSAKNRLSLPAAAAAAVEKHTVPSPGGTRRHSGPPKVEISPAKDGVKS